MKYLALILGFISSVYAASDAPLSSEACRALVRNAHLQQCPNTRPFRKAIELYRSAVNRSLSRFGTPQEQTAPFIHAAKEMADRIGVKYEILEGHARDGVFPLLRILPVKGTPANEEALRVHSAFGGMKLILSPYELKKSNAEAFFIPNGRAIGVPFDFLYHPFSSNYLHEVQHATSYFRLIMGYDDTFVGSFHLLQGEALSAKNSLGYTRRASVDEIIATEFSIQTHARQLAWNYRSAKSVEAKREFYADPENERLLNELYHELRILPGLARQSEELMRAAREKIVAGKYRESIEKIVIGTSLSAKVEKVEILVPSTEKVIANSRGVDQRVEDGARVTLYGIHQNREQLLKRVDRVIEKSGQIPGYYRDIIRKIYNPTGDIADLRRTNIEALIRTFPPSMR